MLALHTVTIGGLVNILGAPMAARSSMPLGPIGYVIEVLSLWLTKPEKKTDESLAKLTEFSA